MLALPSSASAARRLNCRVGPANPVPRIVGAGSEPKILVRTPTVSAVCPVGSKDLRRLSLSVRIQIKDVGGQYVTFTENQGSQTYPFPALRVQAQRLCAAGTHSYRTDVTAKAKRVGPDIRDHYYSDSARLNCNEAGAWRYQAHLGGSSPSATLGAALSASQEPPPTASGWEAHHIVPANFESGRGGDGAEGRLTRGPAARAEAIGYACGIPPNDPGNGIWLRGPSLKAGRPGFRKLSRAQRRRAYHRTLHTQRYFRWLENGLRPAISGNANCDVQVAGAFLGRAKYLLARNRAPH